MKLVAIIASLVLPIIMVIALLHYDGDSSTCIINDEPCHKNTGSCRDCHVYKSSKYYKEGK